MFWEKELETIKRGKLEALQLKRLKETATRVYNKVPYYKKLFKSKGVTPGDIRTINDISKLPFTTRDDLQKNYPDKLLTIKHHDTMRLHTSSGTTGKPKAVFFTKKDIDVAANNIARCLTMTGVTKVDVLQNMMSYGLFTGGLMMHYGAEKVGALVIPSAIGNTERQLMFMQDFKTTAIHLTPSYALYLSDIFEKKGPAFRKKLKLKRAYMGAEPYTEETKNKIEKILKLKVYNSYGLTEMNGPGVAFECEYQSGMHLWEDCYLMEIVDPKTDRPLPEGKTGELILTTLNREGMPIIRYRTRDITAIIPEKCKCGRTHRRIMRIKGRADDMFIIRGVNIYPQQIERVLMSVTHVEKNYQIYLEDNDKMTVKVEITKKLFDGNLEHLKKLQSDLTEKLRTEILVRPNIDLVEPGTLPVSEGKAKRVFDNRKIY
ncbi:MAG: phenylacetate--CoA ligase [Candidatus Firestonebacteria bacterium RIFOXYC2_FULL_39_67]|nr:MAG: phenylacetate--CoA ligase [Candidatus Firestonebacteria bacterium RIFOXYD2_FULL_39_29]OGF54026.1 MAG: phenylacetate--CoA ligase [Candidatus Firestonebacteria bacterium RifOxyC12_full_39_7]OGF56362.1 MAG: phenylacetate--CoA ligase [Candidatus Firestonebacteria bacterium RIFOXYC2_FULL_39_67]